MPSWTDLLLSRDAAETISDRDARNVVILAAREPLTVTWSRYAPGERGPDLHVHHEHTDAFYVLEGELTFALGPGGEPVRARAGTFVAVPPDVAHGFANESAAQARWLNLHAPDAGFAAFMRGARDGREVPFDSFDVPAGGGLPAARAVVCGPGEGEPVAAGGRSGSIRGALPHLCVVEWTDGPPEGVVVRDGDALYDLGDGRVLQVRAPGDGLAEALRAGAG